MPIDLGIKKLSCPECGGKAKRQRKKIFGRKMPGAVFKCTKCDAKFHVMF